MAKSSAFFDENIYFVRCSFEGFQYILIGWRSSPVALGNTHSAMEGDRKTPLLLQWREKDNIDRRKC
jgi:hypothetical protein